MLAPAAQLFGAHQTGAPFKIDQAYRRISLQQQPSLRHTFEHTRSAANSSRSRQAREPTRGLYGRVPTNRSFISDQRFGTQRRLQEPVPYGGAYLSEPPRTLTFILPAFMLARFDFDFSEVPPR